MSPVSIIIVALADVAYSNKFITGYFGLFAMFVHIVRLYGWYTNKIWSVPLVWILHIAYSWFIIGFLLKASVIIDLQWDLFSYHAFTVGGIGIMTLGMMARVSLGHTGREMKVNNWMVLSFILINVAAILRVIIPVVMPENYMQLVQYSGLLWVSAFLLFLVIFVPVWFKSRVD